MTLKNKTQKIKKQSEECHKVVITISQKNYVLSGLFQKRLSLLLEWVIIIIDVLNEYIVAIYQLHKAQYGLIVVTLMAVVGVSVGLFTEIILRLFGIKGE